MAQSVRAKSTNEATAESLAGLGFLGLFLIIFVIPTIGYIIFLLKTPWKFKIFQEYGIEIDKIKKLKIISIILSLVSSTLVVLTMLNENTMRQNYNLPFGNDFLLALTVMFIIISILLLFKKMASLLKELK